MATDYSVAEIRYVIGRELLDGFEGNRDPGTDIIVAGDVPRAREIAQQYAVHRFIARPESARFRFSPAFSVGVLAHVMAEVASRQIEEGKVMVARFQEVEV